MIIHTLEKLLTKEVHPFSQFVAIFEYSKLLYFISDVTEHHHIDDGTKVMNKIIVS